MVRWQMSEARKDFSTLVERASRGEWQVVGRRARDEVLLADVAEIAELLATAFPFSPEVFVEKTGVEIWLPELEVYGQGSTLAAAKDDLVEAALDFVDSWEIELRAAPVVDDAPGRRVSRHEVWTKRLPDGRMLHTAISKGRDEYGGPLFARVLKAQLCVTAAEFWRAVDKGEPPQRPGGKRPRPQGDPLPFALAERLLAAGLPQAELAGLSQADAKRRLEELERRT